MKNHQSWLNPVLAAVMLVTLAGCGSPFAPTPRPPQLTPAAPVDAPVAYRSGLARETPTAPEADVLRLAAGNRAFAVNLYHQLAGQPGNLFISPYSISLALAMVEGGAQGATRDELRAALAYPLEGEALHAAWNALDQALAQRQLQAPDPGQRGFRLNIANAIWGQAGYPFRQEYLDLLARHYGAGLQGLDFGADPEGARQVVNDWVAEQTEDKIRDIIAPGTFDDLTRLVLANAIYFNAGWQEPFDPELTEPDRFHNLDGSTASAEMMLKQAHFAYAAGQDYQAIGLPYMGGSLDMVVIVPTAGQFAAFEQGLTAERLEAILDALSFSEVRLRLPRFQVESQAELSTALQALGMRRAFSPGEADFSPMAEVDEDLSISQVMHQAFVDVNESGTEAAAATVVVMAAGAAPEPVEPVALTVDRPFVFLIRDIPTGSVLFLGRVTELRGG